MPVKERKYYFIIVFVVIIITINQFLINRTTVLVNVTGFVKTRLNTASKVF